MGKGAFYDTLLVTGIRGFIHRRRADEWKGCLAVNHDRNHDKDHHCPQEWRSCARGACFQDLFPPLWTLAPMLVPDSSPLLKEKSRLVNTPLTLTVVFR
jgi:hypothetical protein